MKLFSSLIGLTDSGSMGAVGTSEAAKQLGVSPRRVAAMITQGIIQASKIGNTWIIEEEEVARVKSLERPAGRPKKPKH
jgi:excisionase family DNA binding protein